MKNSTTVKVPKKYEHMIEEMYRDSDGYWAFTKYGFYSPDMGCHTMREDTQAEILKVIRNIEPCKCKECIEELEQQGGQDR